MSRMVNEIKSVYSYFDSDENKNKYIGKEGLMYTRIEGVIVGNYHLYKIFGDTSIISSQAKGTDYQTKICMKEVELKYRQKGICDGFIRWDVLFEPEITYPEYGYFDLWQ
jgi:hypothetical protein